MLNEIIWSPLAKEDLDNILGYLNKNWSNKIALNFIDILDGYLWQIAINPKQFPIINQNLKVRKCVVTKHNSLYYKQNNDRIEVLRLFDNRQDPDKLRFSLIL
jgi:plasmid stabilization system protein ParE